METLTRSVRPVGRATFLFVRPSFLDGVATLLNIGGRSHARYATSASPQEADRRALTQDWAAVGDSLRGAMASRR